MIGLLGTLVNTATVIAGALIGMLLKKGIPKRVSDTVFFGLALVTIFIGVSGSLVGENTLIAVIVMVLGALIGEIINIDKRVNSLGKKLENKFDKGNERSTFAQGFTSASLLFCVGAMTIVGCLQAGINGDNTILFTKSAMDFVSSMIFASTMGVGVLFSAVFVLVYQGLITLLAGVISPLLTDAVINEMSCVGFIIIIGLGLNMLNVTKLKIMNFVPAIFLPILFCPLYDRLASILLGAGIVI